MWWTRTLNHSNRFECALWSKDPCSISVHLVVYCARWHIELCKIWGFFCCNKHDLSTHLMIKDWKLSIGRSMKRTNDEKKMVVTAVDTHKHTHTHILISTEILMTFDVWLNERQLTCLFSSLDWSACFIGFWSNFMKSINVFWINYFINIIIKAKNHWHLFNFIFIYIFFFLFHQHWRIWLHNPFLNSIIFAQPSIEYHNQSWLIFLTRKKNEKL